MFSARRMSPVAAATFLATSSNPASSKTAKGKSVSLCLSSRWSWSLSYALKDTTVGSHPRAASLGRVTSTKLIAFATPTTTQRDPGMVGKPKSSYRIAWSPLLDAAMSWSISSSKTTIMG